MLKTLRRKFIRITMVSVLLVFTIIMTAINLWNYHVMVETADGKLEMLLQSDGSLERLMPPERPLGRPVYTEETPFNTRYFTVVFNDIGAIEEVHMDYIAAVTDEEAKAYATDLWTRDKSSGYVDVYRYGRTKTKGRVMYVFLDCSEELAGFYSFLQISVWVSLLGLILIFLLVVWFSGIAVRPVAESYEKQKRFITDASHEIKTPLAIIDANTEVLQLEQGDSEWLQSIRHQVKRLASLTEKLVFLSRMEEEHTKIAQADFDLGEAINETVESFAPVAEAKGKFLTADLAPNVSYRGDESMIRQMMSLLIDNAMKYSKEKGTVKVTLKQNGRHPVIMVWNSVASIEKGDLSMMFERFYRKDASRNSETGGHGIGLSVVQAIVVAHKGKITAESKDGKSVLFTITL